MQTRSSDENSVCPFLCPSVSPSVKHVDRDETEERSVQIFVPFERSFSLVFWEEEWLVEATPSTWNFRSAGPRWSEIAYFEPIFARSASAITPNGKSSINANRKSTTRFSMSLRWSSYLAPKPPKWSSEAQNGDFRYKSCQRQSCKAFIGLSIRAEMIGGDVTFCLILWVKWAHWSKIADFFKISFRR